MASINAQDVQGAISLISMALPQVMTAYQLFKVIWLRTNPGKTEADFLTYLQTASQANIDDSAAILTADGFVEVSPGNWVKK